MSKKAAHKNVTFPGIPAKVEETVRHTPAHTFELKSYVKDGKKVKIAKNQVFVTGVTWFRCRKFMGIDLNVDSTSIDLKPFSGVVPAQSTHIKVPDA